MRKLSSITSAGLRRGGSSREAAGPKRLLRSTALSEIAGSPGTESPSLVSAQDLKDQRFDSAFIERLRNGDPDTKERFVAYFSRLTEIKLGLRLQSQQAIEDLRRETFARVFVSLRDPKVQPNRLGSLVNSTCNAVLLEYAQFSSYERKNDTSTGFSSIGSDSKEALSTQESQDRVRRILETFSDCDRQLLRAVFVEKRDKDAACRSFGVSRDYLLCLLHRARQSLRQEHLENTGTEPSTALTA